MRSEENGGGEYQEVSFSENYFAQVSWAKALQFIEAQGRNIMGLHAVESDLVSRFYQKNQT